MKHIKHLKLLFAALIVMIGVFSVGSNTFASLPGCDINSIEPENVSVQADNGDIEHKVALALGDPHGIMELVQHVCHQNRVQVFM